MPPKARFRLDSLVLALLPFVPFLPLPYSAAGILAVSAIWLWLRPARREVLVALPFLLIAFGVLAGPSLLQNFTSSHPIAFAEHAEVEYRDFWQRLELEANTAADVVNERLERLSRRNADRREAFRIVADLVAVEPEGRPTLLLVDPDGEPIAWAGEGLIHEPRPSSLIRDGTDFIASYGAVTVLAVSPLSDERRPWRIVAGRSYATDRWPFGASLADSEVLWSLAEDRAELQSDSVGIEIADAPVLGFRHRPAPGLSDGERTPAVRWAWGAIGLMLLGLAVPRAVGLALPSDARDRTRVARFRRFLSFDRLRGFDSRGEVLPEHGLGIAILVALGSGSLGLASPAELLSVGALSVGVLVAALTMTWPRLRWNVTVAASLGGLGVVLVGAASWWLQGQIGSIDLGAVMWPNADALCLRLALGSLGVAWFCLFGRSRAVREGGGSVPDQWAWAAIGLLIAGGALCDLPWVGIPLLAGGAAAMAAWTAGRWSLLRLTSVSILLLAGSLMAAGSWETLFRWQLKQSLADEVLPEMAPPDDAERSVVEYELRRFFEHFDASTLITRNADGLALQDLALTIWRRSPLARPNVESALFIELLVDGVSSFSLGLPLRDGQAPDLSSDVLGAGWPWTVIQDGAVLELDGKPWALARYWLRPTPGFRFFDFDESSVLALSEVELELLRSGAVGQRQPEGLPAGVSYGLYGGDTRAVISPWNERPPLPQALADSVDGSEIVATPEGPAWALATLERDGWEVLYLPLLRPGRALERVGAHALGTMMIWAIGVVAGLLFALPRAAFRDLLRRTYRSYSKKLIIIFTALLLLPLVLLNLFLLSVAENRLRREQQEAGAAALGTAERLLATNVADPQPGFSLATAFEEQELIRVARAVRHEVNLYWDSFVHRSSKSELFAVGLLPRRIPGEIYSRLTLLGFGDSARVNRVGDTGYLELYAPIRIPGVPFGGAGLFVSLPLLAQEEAVAEELASLRRQALLLSATLFVLVIAVGVGVGRSFTKPIEQLVEETRRIAGGATSLAVKPADLELGALATAIDDMARRIAEARQKLVREKQVVERIVDSITSGVVSLDRRGRVQMHNRVAGQLLGIRSGQRLEDELASSERLRSVADFVAKETPGPRRTTVRLTWSEAQVETGFDENEPSGQVTISEEGGDQEWSLVWVPVPGVGEPAALLIVEDATEVLRGQRLQAWAEMARIIAHEIKNPLTPIRLSTEHLKLVYKERPDTFDEVFERLADNILRHVDELRQIASEFSIYSAIPQVETQPADLVPVLRELVEGYQAAPPAGVDIRFSPEVDSLPARFDARLLTRAVRNLMENALRASSGGGAVELTVQQSDTSARIAVLDSGPGVSAADISRIFDPYFSTHDTGTGLGLPITRRIVEEHGGKILARNRPSSGLEVVIRIPLS